MDPNKTNLEERINIFIQQYNYYINEIYLLRNKIVDNSKIRFISINEFLANLEEETKKELKEKENELDNYCERDNVILSIATKLLEDYDQTKIKSEETRELLLNSEEEYNNEVTKFNKLVNNSITNVSIEENLNELEKIGELGYFDEKLVEELINILKKYNLIVLSWKEIDEEIAITNLNNNINKHR